MHIFTTHTKLQNYLQCLDTQTIGFVPTMGALHDGHASLIRRAKKENDITLVSIFVNPRQFNDAADYEKYPRTTDNDLFLLESIDCDVVYLPQEDDIYANFNSCKIDFKGLDKIYEGQFRAGHFQGVVDVVYRLFDIVKPTNAYFGEKDFQQLAIIKLMVEQKNLPINIVSCEIVREASGLAMSSRNKRLSADKLKFAAEIYRILQENCKFIERNLNKLSEQIINEINNVPFLETEYVIFCKSDTLEQIYEYDENIKTRICVAVWCGNVRLIDNFCVSMAGEINNL